MSQVPDHPTHDVQFSVTYVHTAKQTIRKNAAQTYRRSKLLVAEAVIGMNFELSDTTSGKDGKIESTDQSEPIDGTFN